MCDYQLVSCSSYGTLVVNFGSLWRSRLYVVSFSVTIWGGLCAVCPYGVLRCVSSFVRLFLLLFLVFVLVRGVNVPCFCCPLSFDVACCVVFHYVCVVAVCSMSLVAV